VPTPLATPTPAFPPDGAGFAYDGVTHVSWSSLEYGTAAGTESRRALANTGAGWAGLLVTWYMEGKSSNTIAPAAGISNDDAVVRQAIDELHALGLQVMLKPHVDVRDGTWRAQITPADPTLWWESYAAFMNHYAAIAAEKDVGLFCIGTELASMSGRTYAREWSQLIADVRSEYRGPLTYAANGVDAADEFTSVAFWDELDLLGTDVYTPLTNAANPTRSELVAAWRRNRSGHDMVAAFRSLHLAHGRPLVFTEIGYRSGDGANRAPWDWGQSMTPRQGRRGRAAGLPALAAARAAGSGGPESPERATEPSPCQGARAGALRPARQRQSSGYAHSKSPGSTLPLGPCT
jgi:hypothetical protein